MTKSQALIPARIFESQNQTLSELSCFTLGLTLLIALAQVAVPLPWTPVPITGQTLAVTFIALLWGSRRAFSIVAVYLAMGAFGLPVFALGNSGLVLGPTAGYLLGMLLSSYAVGFLADQGFTRSLFRSFIAAICGSFLVFSLGLAVLSIYSPREHLLDLGFFPFLPGDLIKNFLAASISWRINQHMFAQKKQSVRF